MRTHLAHDENIRARHVRAIPCERECQLLDGGEVLAGEERGEERVVELLLGAVTEAEYGELNDSTHTCACTSRRPRFAHQIDLFDYLQHFGEQRVRALNVVAKDALDQLLQLLLDAIA